MAVTFYSLECYGFFPLWLKRQFLGDMSPSWVKTTKSLGKLSPYISFGLFGRKETC